MLRQRILSAFVFIPILLAAIWFGDPWFSILIAIIAFLGAREFYRLAAQSGGQPFSLLGTILILLFILNAHFKSPQATSALISAAIILPLIRLLWCPDKRQAFINWAWTIGGIFYLGWLLSYFILLRGMDEGRSWVILALFTTFAADSAAFLIGRSWGQHHLVPQISPGKTWEGAAGSLIGGIVGAIILAFILKLTRVGYGWIILLGLLVGGFAQLGDLVESALKRSAGVKESGGLIPGHGGILDRLDSLVFTIVLVYYYLMWLI